MSYRKQYFEWDVQANEVISGVPVGYEVEFSQNPRFYPILYRITTFEEVQGETLQGKFYYSLDNGATWVDFPLGESGMAFSQPYKMRLIVAAAETGYIFAQRDAIIYRLTGDGRSIIDSYEISGTNLVNQMEIQERDDVLCLVGSNNTLYKLFAGENVAPFSNSLNINENPLAIAVDSYRKSFWEINESTVCLKTMNGEEIFCLENPLTPIDVDYSSSSSSSSSSFGYSTSSSSSSDLYFTISNSQYSFDGNYLWDGSTMFNGRKVFFNGSHTIKYLFGSWWLFDSGILQVAEWSVGVDGYPDTSYLVYYDPFYSNMGGMTLSKVN